MSESKKKGKSGTKSGTVVSDDRLHPPDKKKFEQDIAEINHRIKDLEAKLRAVQTDSSVYQSIGAELTKLQAELLETEKMRAINKNEVRKIEDRLKSLGENVIKKKDEASSLLAGMRFNTESKINDTISKLRSQMLSKQLSDSDHGKYKREIENLEKSKLQLREFTQAKEAADRMRSEQDELRKKRDSCYRLSHELKEKEMKIKERMAELRASLEHAKEKRREVSTQKDSISKDIDNLHKRHRQLLDTFRSQQADYQEERMRIRQEEERKREEARQAQKEAKFKRKLNQEMSRAVLYDDVIATAKALIAHLQATRGSTSSPSDYFGNEGVSPSSSSTNLDGPEHDVAAATVGGVASTRDNAVVQKPGEFLRKKGTEDEVLVPATWTVVRRKSKREKKRSTVPKRLNFNPAIFQQFSYLGIQPPSSHAEIADVISKLQEKLTFYESKNKATLGIPAYSEAGDSGVGGMTDISQAQSVATSQEDLHLITVSPDDSINEFKPPILPATLPSRSPSLQHQFANNDDLSDNESSQTVVEDDDSSTPRSNSSMMVAVSSA